MGAFSNEIFHTVIIGAGASGLMCAGSFDKRKLLLDHNPAAGAKIAVSGGGKCNFSNRKLSAPHYLSQNKHFCKNALAAYGCDDFLRLLAQHAIPWEERERGQLFAKNARDIVRMLEKRARQNNTVFQPGTQVLEIKRENGFFQIRTSAGTVSAQYAVIASGGLSFPALGASNFAVKTAKAFGLSVVEQRPALAALVFPRELRERFKPLAGNSLPVHIQTGKFEYAGSLLFTHDGISGPAVLQTSLFWEPGTTVRVNFLPQTDAAQWLAQHKNSSKNMSAVWEEKISAKIAKALLGPLDRDPANASKAQLAQAAAALNRFEFIPYGTAGYSRAEATAGGVDTREINPSTMQVKKLPELYFTGEALDVTGLVGGYNLQWAWSSGYAAAQSLQNKW